MIYNRGVEAEKRGDLEGALALYEEAAKIWPGETINKSLEKTRAIVGVIREQRRLQSALNNANKEYAQPKPSPAATPSSGLQFQGATAAGPKAQGAAAPLEFMPGAAPAARSGSTAVRSGAAEAPALQFMPGGGEAKQQLGSASVSGGRAATGKALTDLQGESRIGTGGPVLQASGAGEGASKEARLNFDTPGRAETPAAVFVPTPTPSIDPAVPAALKSNSTIVEMEGRRTKARAEITMLENERKTLNRSNPKDQVRMSVIDDTVQRQQKVVLFANDEIQKVVKIAGAPIIVDDDEPAKPGAAAPSGAQGAGPRK
jgi:hypothetical protein